MSKALWQIKEPITYLKTFVISSGMTYVQMAVFAGELMILFIADRMTIDGMDPMRSISKLRPVFKYTLYALFLVLILIFSAKNVSTGFIYATF